MAKLPEHLIEKKARTLADLQAGERASYPLYGIRIDAEHCVFAMLNADLDQQDPKMEYGEIWRDSEGAYHVDLKGTQRKWKAEDLRIFVMTERPSVVPITTITGVDTK
jgi:hypothetical protein